MSAFLVSRDHIDYLVSAAFSPNIRPAGLGGLTWVHDGHHVLNYSDYKRAQEVGQMLWEENLKSVEELYPDDDQGLVHYEHSGAQRAMDPVTVMKLVHCYEYQSSEHVGWESSEAHAFCQALIKSAIGVLPGYDDAPWGL